MSIASAWPYRLNELNSQQKGRLGETLAKAVFLANDFEIFESEVDDRGVDFLVKPPKSSRILEMQVKSITKNNYTYLRAKHIKEITKETRWVIYIRLDDIPYPSIYLIPLNAWEDNIAALQYRDYSDPCCKSDAEYGISGAKKNIDSLKPYRIDRIIEQLINTSCLDE